MAKRDHRSKARSARGESRVAPQVPAARPTVPPVRVPVESRAPFRLVVSGETVGWMLDRLLRSQLADASWNQVRDWIRQGKAAVDGQKVTEPTFVPEESSEVEFLPKGRRPEVTPTSEFTISYQDSQLVVVDKPSGLSTVPFEDSERNSLDRLLAARLGQKGRPARVHVVHRLDKGTSGLIVFARTDSALKHLKSQFRFHTTHRRYLALVHGRATTTTYQSRLVTDRGDGRRGSTQNQRLGREAITHVRLLEELAGASLIECRLETGRTHQIRIHLSEAGHPLLGELVYSKGYPGELLAAPRVMLHARELGFVHPATDEPLHFESPPPDDFERALLALRRRG